jgi:hypothetical protein
MRKRNLILAAIATSAAVGLAPPARAEYPVDGGYGLFTDQYGYLVCGASCGNGIKCCKIVVV